MQLLVLRYNSDKEYTDGLLFVDDTFECYTLEDQFQTKKVWGETRIPDGTYTVCLRTEGGFHTRYLNRYGPEFHKGMLHVMDVPGFEFILIHVGNDDDDTAGCLLVGSTADKDKGFIGASRKAYEDLYPKVAEAILAGEEVKITYKTIA